MGLCGSPGRGCPAALCGRAPGRSPRAPLGRAREIHPFQKRLRPTDALVGVVLGALESSDLCERLARRCPGRGAGTVLGLAGTDTTPERSILGKIPHQRRLWVLQSCSLSVRPSCGAGSCKGEVVVCFSPRLSTRSAAPSSLETAPESCSAKQLVND